MPRIEQEIMQRQFRNERHKAIVNIVYTGHWLTARHSKFLKQFHLTEQQFNILRILQGQYPKPASITLLRERMLDKMSDVSRLVERLRKLDFVERRTSRLDRRAVEVSITEKGLEVLSAIEQHVTEVDAMTHNLSMEELEHLNFLLDKLRG
ncbi:MAG: winged helix DNA-binding protein [Bacteroidota bacterium]|nr:winged helix DNA-binding protein [Candidatus Kapabacteria bacterium]MDW8219659.1 winged helix DNA-binding protein [Bacteroidota bacterium]